MAPSFLAHAVKTRKVSPERIECSFTRLDNAAD
jgi:hypothetical protein